MIINKKIEALLNYRIEQEEFSSRLYLAFSVWLDNQGLTGASKLWKKYSEEELTHAGWAYSYLNDLDILPVVPALPKPECTCTCLKDVVQKSLEHEEDITNQCNTLAETAMKECDFLTLTLAQKYLKEQQEELAKILYWLDKLELYGDEPTIIMELDEEMGESL